ncbi:MAG: DUF1398 family protein, partial [Asticcacaulis sp.]
VVGRLMAVGVERYHTDLQRSEKTYFLPTGESYLLATHTISETPAPQFSAEGVAAAVRQIQAGKIHYIRFCEDIMRAGCVGYIVSLSGQRAVYYGRSGETYVEPFPS